MAATNNQKRDIHAGQIARRMVVDGYETLSLSHRLPSLRWLGSWRASLLALKSLVMPGRESMCCQAMAPAPVDLGRTDDRNFTGRIGNARQPVPPVFRQR